MLYRQYKDTLQAHGLYRDKCKQLIPVFNSITEKSKFEGVYISFNELANIVLPYKISKITNETEFRSCFDSVENNFIALARDYLLSQLMYRAYTRRIPISSNYLAKYETACFDKSYKKLVYNIKLQQEENDNKAIGIGNNSLLSVDGKTIASLENIITKHRGKLILIDFWATWCAPCRQEMPSLRKLMQEYKEDKVVFVSLSMDKEVQPWRKYVIANNTEIKNNYIISDIEKSTFVKQFGINSILRYMIIDKEGQIINSEAPRPSDPKLKALIDKGLE
ncbi:MAG: TlpA disulfide reductase family protein [Segetibacter sp.]